MTDSMHPEVAADETNTVEVILNGHHHLKSVFIEEVLLRLGAATVDRERLDHMVATLTQHE